MENLIKQYSVIQNEVFHLKTRKLLLANKTNLIEHKISVYQTSEDESLFKFRSKFSLFT